MSDDIILEQDGRILRATFNTPPDNGVSDVMAGQFSEAILAAHENSDMVLLRSTGPDFCTGRIRDASGGNTIRSSIATAPSRMPRFRSLP